MTTTYLPGAPPFGIGLVDFPTPGSIPLETSVDAPVLNSGWEGKAYLLRVTAYDADPEIKGVTTTYPAATIGKSTEASDTPASTAVPAQLRSGLNYGLRIMSDADPMSAKSNTVGRLAIDDPGGRLDSLRLLGWDGATLALLRGEPTTAFSTWSVVASVTAAGIFVNRNTKEISLRDLSWFLQSAPLHGQVYGGTGSADGHSGLVGVTKPYAAGYVFECSPVAINTSLLIYQLSCSSIKEVNAVRFAGVALDYAGDVASYAALAATTVAAASFKTCLAEGLIRVGSSPTGNVTVDFFGDNDTIGGTPPPRTRGQIARRIATGRGALKLTESQLDTDSFMVLDNQQGATCGFYWAAGEQVSKADALNRVMSGCLGWWFVRLSGLLVVGVTEDPASATAYFSVSFPVAGASTGVRAGEPEMVDQKPPRQGTYIGWSFNHTVQTANQLAGSLSQDDIAIFSTRTRWAVSLDSLVATNYPTSPTVYIEDSGYAYQRDAEGEALRQQLLCGVPRELWKIPAVLDPTMDLTGRIVEVAHMNRYDFGSSRKLLNAGVDANPGSPLVQYLWG